MNCPNCGKEEATIHPTFGIIVGLDCKAKRDKLRSPDHIVEFTSQSIKSERKQFAPDIVQPFRGNEASKEFLDVHPEKAKKIFSEKEIKNIKNVWN